MRISVTDGMDARAVEKLRGDGYEVVEQFYEPEALGGALREFDAVVIRSATKIKEPQIDAAKGGRLKLIIRAGVTNMGFIAMKGMAGGLIRDGFTAAAWMAQQDGVVPIWGVQRESELDQFLQCIREGVELTNERKATIECDRKELCGEFCRGCGYCMPCPAGIEINQCARMSLMLRRAPAAAWLTEEWQQKMHQIENCRHCGHCMSKCPYGLNTPELLQANYKDYWEVLAASKAEK